MQSHTPLAPQTFSVRRTRTGCGFSINESASIEVDWSRAVSHVCEVAPKGPSKPLEHRHPCASKGLGKPFDAAWLEKSVPPLLPELFELARALQTSGSTHYPPG
jgi:hypothetical protein